MASTHTGWSKGLLVLERFQLVHKLGSGSYGVVWEATDQKHHGRRVVLKSLLEATVAHQEALRQEMEALCKVTHPNLVPLYEADLDADPPFLCECFLDGDLLSHKLDTLEEPEIWSLFEGICRGVGALHDKNIAHRDLKPDNVMLIGHGTERRPVVFDLGLARLSLSRHASDAGGLIGTPFYAPPEQCLSNESDIRTDVWSLARAL